MADLERREPASPQRNRLGEPSFLLASAVAAVVVGTALIFGLVSPASSPTLLKPALFVGDYVYFSADRARPHDPDRLTLRADATYRLVHMAGGHPGLTVEGAWRLTNTDGTSVVVFGGRSYAVEIQGKSVRLWIDEVLGHSYDKTD